jgi:hypothetical protein
VTAWGRAGNKLKFKKMEKFKKEWDKKDFAKVDRKIRAYFGGNTFINHRGEKETVPTNKQGFEKCLGIPYTSSGIFACYSLSCNTNLFWDKDFYFDYAVIREVDQKVCLILSDSEENERVIAL